VSAPRVLCIAGSPRRPGNTDRLLDEFAAGVTEAGGIPVRLAAASLDLAGCRGCGGCSKTGECVVDDEMGEVYRLIDSATAIGVATPVYFASVPSQLKALFDRCQPYWARRYLLHEPAPDRKRPGAIMVVGGGGDPFGTACAVAPVRSVFAVLGVSGDDVLEVVGPDARGDVARDAAALASAREMGRSVAHEAGGAAPARGDHATP